MASCIHFDHWRPAVEIIMGITYRANRRQKPIAVCRDGRSREAAAKRRPALGAGRRGGDLSGMARRHINIRPRQGRRISNQHLPVGVPISPSGAEADERPVRETEMSAVTSSAPEAANNGLIGRRAGEQTGETELLACLDTELVR